jgi:hypothetical protein
VYCADQPVGAAGLGGFLREEPISNVISGWRRLSQDSLQVVSAGIFVLASASTFSQFTSFTPSGGLLRHWGLYLNDAFICAAP